MQIFDSKSFVKDCQQERAKRDNHGIYHFMQVKFAYNSNKMEGSSLSEDQTRDMFDLGSFISQKDTIIRSNDVIETQNHFRAFDFMLDNYEKELNPAFIKSLHFILKNGISIQNPTTELIGEFKIKANFIGDTTTSKPKNVAKDIDALLANYNKSQHSVETIIDFHFNFEKIHPFYDGNGRVGRLLMFKECLKHEITPFIIYDENKAFYIRGLKEYENTKGYLVDTCLASQDDFIEKLKELGDEKYFTSTKDITRIKDFKYNYVKFNAYETEYNTINKDFSEGKIDENTKKQAFESLENKFSIKVAEFELLLTERSNARKVEAAKVKFQTNPQNEISQDKELDR